MGFGRKVNRAAACEINEAAVSKTETNKIFGKGRTLGGWGIFFILANWPIFFPASSFQFVVKSQHPKNWPNGQVVRIGNGIKQ